MPFNLNNFRAKMSLDGARPNLFQVRMNLPAFATKRRDYTSANTNLVL
jgi:hypothetical protein